MSTPASTCEAGWPLVRAATLMRNSEIGSVIVTERDKVAGILTERDLLWASAAGVDPAVATVGLWMTAHPDVLGPDEEVDAAWSSLTHHHYRHLPVVESGQLLGVVSLRDLMAMARLRPPAEASAEVPPGLEGVVVAETALGDVRGEEGFYHYRQYSAIDLAQSRSLEDVWYLMFFGELPGGEEARRFSEELAVLRDLPPRLRAQIAELAATGGPLEVLRSAVSMLGVELGWRPSLDTDDEMLRAQAIQLCAVVPTILSAAWNLRRGAEMVDPRHDLAASANYLWMLAGVEPTETQARAVEQYQILTVDHGFNASTFAARVIASTGADLAAAVGGAVGALSGPLHGGAPSRALAMLDDIGAPERAEIWVREAVERGERIMGFGHRVYKTNDPRSLFLRDLALSLGGPVVQFATEVEEKVVDVLTELKPGRRLYANVEFYAGVVMQACGIPPEMFTPTFAVGRTIGWCSHILEQVAHNRLIRPTARYVGVAPPVAVPARR